ncbi:hypothetical protein IA57_04460 [Mangrovimonas yunxiaonensis]|uniref:Pyrrolo-quinoline quinone repeat domain-containing protein n=2 Tax=Mangrovimonas yunxiaonensis TaxID=1197477 RepID=A0A084TK57_9FLAO|nr:PQQ-binding-like beta-propeller repeat protein [Mangrovimonas yunxiaonensis]KFB01093.1 hypothetical protein IA57_04460 [Mangrovimonas yunxiaonensis]GGH38721.1 hypothetical protein GCM10011364_07680 [Mangrovimonas yunxiaonensis]
MKTTILFKMLIFCVCICLGSPSVFAQDTTNATTIKLDFTPDFIDFSPDDRYMVAENETRYLVWDTQTNNKVVEGKYAFKIGRFAKSISIPSGSGYFLFGNEKVFITIDYQHNNSHIKAFNLKDGTQIWETNQLDIGIGLTETLISAHAGSTLDVEVNGIKLSKPQLANNFFTRDRFLDRLINYVPEKHAIALNGKNGLQLIDVRNGKILWTQQAFKGGIGELLYNAPSNKLLAITVPATDGAIDLLTTTPEVIALNATTGTIAWKVAYTGDFMPNYASIVNNTLVLPYLELAFIDLKTGTERQGDVHSRMAAAKNVTKGLGGLMAIDKAMGGSFGANANQPSKYNRLIPRALHFNNQGKLCYFTMFDKNGTWGTGGKKGYTIIDIKKDKIELEVHDLLGSQWTPLQDAMANGIFYVKASGNLNRTTIKAIDARNGKELFETEKAKNSADISKAFNPFMIDTHNNRLIDVVSKGVYIFNAKTGENMAYTSTKDLGVGTVKFSEFFANGLLIFGTKGVGVIDFKGNIIASVSTKNIKGFAATAQEIQLLENKRFIRIDANTGKLLEEQPLGKTNQIAFSPSGKTLARAKGAHIELFQ